MTFFFFCYVSISGLNTKIWFLTADLVLHTIVSSDILIAFPSLHCILCHVSGNPIECLWQCLLSHQRNSLTHELSRTHLDAEYDPSRGAHISSHT